MEAALAALAEHGPGAVLAGVIIVVLWQKLTALQMKYEGDPSDTTGEKVGLIRRLQIDAQDREDKLRKHYEKRHDEERAGQRKMNDDLNDTLKGLYE